MSGKKRKSRGIPNNWEPEEYIFIEECKKYKARELAEKYNVCIDKICDWKKLFGISHGPLKPRLIKWKINKNSCWICVSHKPSSTTGYPFVSKRSILKLKYEERFGKIPKGKCMLHKCDERRCINPDHVIIGTKGDNCRDRHAKKRDCFGVKSPQHKLDKEKIIFAKELRSSGYYYWQIADFFGVSTSTICDALTNRSWVQEFGGEKNRRIYKCRE